MSNSFNHAAKAVGLIAFSNGDVADKSAADAIRSVVEKNKYVPPTALSNASSFLQTLISDGRSIVDLPDSRILPGDSSGYGYYLGSKISVPWYVSLHGRGAQSTFRFDNSSPDILFALNTNDSGDWIQPYAATNCTTIKDMFFSSVNAGALNNNKKITLFQLGCPALIENIQAGRITTFVKQINQYMDQVTIRRVQIYNQHNPDGNAWLIDLDRSGDTILIDQCHFYRNDKDNGIGPDDERPMAIRVRYKAAGTISNIIGGDILIDSCKTMTVRALHHEVGFVFWKDSSGTLSDSSFWMRGLDNGAVSGVPIQISNTGSATSKPHVVVLRDSCFVYHRGFPGGGYHTGHHNFTVAGPLPTGIVKVENLWRDNWSEIGGYESPARIGVTCGDADFDDYSHITSRKSELSGKAWNFREDFSEVPASSSGIDIASSQMRNEVFWEGSAGTYYYKATLLLDKKRMIGLAGSGEKSFTITSGGYGPSLSFLPDFQRPGIMRLYRGTTTGSYTHYVDVPVLAGARLFDNGNDVCGYAWVSRTAGAVDAVNNLSVLNMTIQPGERVNTSDAYGNVKLRVRSSATIPTTGAWRRGDEIQVEGGTVNGSWRLTGWRRATNCTQASSANVLGTDWVEVWDVISDVASAILGFQNYFRPPTRNSLGIEAAISACVAAGGGTVLYENADYAITQDHTLVKNVNHQGFKPKLIFSGDIPDANFSSEGGTRFILSAGVTGFKFNNVAKVTDEDNIAEASLPNVKVTGITFVGGKRAIDIGAYLAMGATYSEFDELYAFDQTDDFAFNFINFQHCVFGRLYTSTQLTSGSGVRFGAALSATLLPGNSTVRDEIYTYCKNRKNRSVVIESFGPSGCVLNQFKVSGRLQGNRYGAATADTISMSFTLGSANIVVSNSTQFDLMVPDMPLVFTSSVAGFTEKTVYFVKSRDAGNNTITLAESCYAASAINASATTTGTAKCSGFPALEVIGRAGCSIIHADFGYIDAEAYANVCAVHISKTRYCTGYLAEIMTSETGTALACRDVVQGLTYSGQASLTQDESPLFGEVNVCNDAGGPFVYSGGSFTLNASHNGKDYRYSGTTDITITVPNNLPKGFKFSITPTAATGVVTFASSSGGAVFSSTGLKTNGQYSTAELKNIANRVYHLTIDSQPAGADFNLTTALQDIRYPVINLKATLTSGTGTTVVRVEDQLGAEVGTFSLDTIGTTISSGFITELAGQLKYTVVSGTGVFTIVVSIKK